MNAKTAVVTLLLFITSIIGASAFADVLEPNVNKMLAAHNEARKKVNAPPLKWSQKLAKIAKSWAETLKRQNCAFRHNQTGYGENLYKASAVMWSDGRRELQNVTDKQVVDSWVSEEKYYDYASNSCSGVCGHYTQVIWSTTREVGCGVAVCDDKSQIWVCNYDPPGNWRGRRPY